MSLPKRNNENKRSNLVCAYFFRLIYFTRGLRAKPPKPEPAELMPIAVPLLVVNLIECRGKKSVINDSS
jgi:hypothetical protein